LFSAFSSDFREKLGQYTPSDSACQSKNTSEIKTNACTDTSMYRRMFQRNKAAFSFILNFNNFHLTHKNLKGGGR
jgi:hypothetical protein